MTVYNLLWGKCPLSKWYGGKADPRPARAKHHAYARTRWPDVITANLWPYALREASESLNATLSKVTGKVANQLFSRNDTQADGATTLPLIWMPDACRE